MQYHSSEFIPSYENVTSFSAYQDLQVRFSLFKEAVNHLVACRVVWEAETQSSDDAHEGKAILHDTSRNTHDSTAIRVVGHPTRSI